MINNMAAGFLITLVLGLCTMGVYGHGGEARQQPPVRAAQGSPSLQAGGAVTPQHGLYNTTAGGIPDPTLHYMDIRMPGVRPTQEDQYICTGVQMPAEVQYIVNFEALATADLAHHLIVYGCDQPANNAPWDCRSICAGQGPKILYAWAKNAPATHMPPDVGFQIGIPGVRTLVLQIHYKTPVRSSDPPDNSGVRLKLSKQRQKYIAGVYLLFLYALPIPPHTPVIYGDVSCKYNGATTLYPFGFRVHAHSLSTVISGYQNNGTWSLLGKGNPQWPQAFYPINGHHQIKPGDYLFARCTFNTTNKSTATRIGGNHDDEMCNFYMMYYTDANNGQSYMDCGGNNVPNMVKDLPAGSDVRLPPNPALEDEAIHRHSHHLQAVEAAGTGWPALTPDDGVTLGQVAGVAVDQRGNIHVFHRASRVWQQSSFDMNNYFNPTLGPIPENTIITFNPQGKVIKQWGAGMFYMPHGLHVDAQDNVWVTDVGLHQVFKFAKDSSTPSLTLGTRLKPGSDDHHFCKPSDVATLSTGEFFVTDGYCNSRILKYSPDGNIITQWGTKTKGVDSNNLPPSGSFDLPHSVTVLEKRGWVCVADRENGRIQCFTTAGSYVKQFYNKEFAGRLFAVSYSAVTDTLYAVNGPSPYNKPVLIRGFSIHPDTGHLMEMWGPKEEFHNPHDLAVSPQGDFIYVAELDPHKVWRMYVHKEILEAQKAKKADLLTHPSSVDGGMGSNSGIKKTEGGDLGASLVIGALLVVPVIFIVAVTVFMRLRKNGRFAFITTMMYRKNRNRRFHIGNLLSRTKGFNRINPDDASDHELDHLNSDSDVEEYSATTRKA